MTWNWPGTGRARAGGEANEAPGLLPTGDNPMEAKALTALL
jgi:hypothetical protein